MQPDLFTTTPAFDGATFEPEQDQERLTGQLATVRDFCCGSGSTLVAAHRLGRTAIGIDQDQRWCRTAAEWLAQGRLAFGT